MTIRKIIQIISFAFFICLFVITTADFNFPIPAYFTFLLNPLSLVVSAVYKGISAEAMIAVTIVIAFTVLFGRIFCGYVCPTGSCIDFFHFAGIRGKKNARVRQFRFIKYLLLLFILVAVLTGFQVEYLFDPIGIFYKFSTLFAYPAVVFSADKFLLWLSYIPPFSDLKYYHATQPVYFGSFLMLIIFAAIIALNIISKRFWCKVLCPLGAFLAVFSFFPLLRKKTAENCNSCDRCAVSCPMEAIEQKENGNIVFDESECVRHQDCISGCPQKSIIYRLRKPSPSLPQPVYDVSKRQFLTVAGAGITAGLLGRTSVYGSQIPVDLIRPPGAVPEQEFISRCVRCGVCMKVCRTNSIQPVIAEMGLEGIFTPRLVMTIGACEKNCYDCNKVCPTGAIRKIPLQEKHCAKIGTAVIDRDRCIAWANNKSCLVCDEVCHYEAILFKDLKLPTGETGSVPVVLKNCTGCGKCETFCPVSGVKAIRIFRDNEIRISKGSYREIFNKSYKREELPEQSSEEKPVWFVE